MTRRRPPGCSIDGCNAAKHYALALCRKHWVRFNEHGSTDYPKRKPNPWKITRPLSFIHKAILHKGNDCVFWPYARNNMGYGHLSYLGKHKLAHRLVLGAWKKCPGPKMVAAHLCGNGHLGCINPQHLAWATQQENIMHRAFHLSAPGWQA